LDPQGLLQGEPLPYKSFSLRVTNVLAKEAADNFVKENKGGKEISLSKHLAYTN
jgi:hypothetical protein